MMPEPGKVIGTCMICGEDLTLDNTHPEDRDYHMCEGGRILHEQGYGAYKEWLATQETVTWDEFFAHLRREGLLPPAEDA